MSESRLFFRKKNCRSFGDVFPSDSEKFNVKKATNNKLQQ